VVTEKKGLPSTIILLVEDSLSSMVREGEGREVKRREEGAESEEGGKHVFQKMGGQFSDYSVRGYGKKRIAVCDYFTR
jgi:hypothetical protein